MENLSNPDCIYLGPSGIDRVGLFSNTAIPAWTKVMEYRGELISEIMADRR
jgi:hypothetical protein